jgi:hypothetical protein
MPASRLPLVTLAASLSTLSLAACSTHTIGTNSASAVAESIGHVTASKRDTCATQKAIASQSSRIDTIINGKETVYKPAPCQEQPVPASKQPEPKTS